MVAKKAAKGRSIRFKPDLGDYALIDVSKTGNVRPFVASAVAVLVNESSTGCCLVVLETEKLKVGDSVVVKVGRLAPLRASVVWLKKLDKEVVKLGIRYLE